MVTGGGRGGRRARTIHDGDIHKTGRMSGCGRLDGPVAGDGKRRGGGAVEQQIRCPQKIASGQGEHVATGSGSRGLT